MSSFVFQIHGVNEFMLYEAIRTLKDGDTIVLSPKPEANPPLELRATVYLWEAGKPQRGLVARGTVVQPLVANLAMPAWQHQFCRVPHMAAPRSTIRIDHIFDPPLPRDKLRLIPALAEANFFGAAKNPQGTVFYVKPKRGSKMPLTTLEAALQQL